MSKPKFNKKEIIRCTYCGRFISEKDIAEGKVKFEHIPDSSYSIEENIIVCEHCNANYNR